MTITALRINNEFVFILMGIVPFPPLGSCETCIQTKKRIEQTGFSGKSSHFYNLHSFKDVILFVGEIIFYMQILKASLIKKIRKQKIQDDKHKKNNITNTYLMILFDILPARHS